MLAKGSEARRSCSDVERQSDTGRHTGSVTYAPIVNTFAPVGAHQQDQGSRGIWGRSASHHDPLAVRRPVEHELADVGAPGEAFHELVDIGAVRTHRQEGAPPAALLPPEEDPFPVGRPREGKPVWARWLLTHLVHITAARPHHVQVVVTRP